MFSGNSRHGGNERHPSPRSVNPFETQQDARAQSGFDSTDMTLDLRPGLDRLAARSDQRFGQSGLKMVACLDGAGINTVGKLDQKDGALRYHVGRRGGRILRQHGYTRKCDQRHNQTNSKTQPSNEHRTLLDLESVCDWMGEENELLPASYPGNLNIPVSLCPREGPETASRSTCNTV